MATDIAAQPQTEMVSTPRADKNTLITLKDWLTTWTLADITPILLTIYLGVSLVLWGFFVMDIATQQFNTLARFNGGHSIAPSEPLTMILLALCGGGIGGLIYNIDKLVKYSKEEGFKTRHTGDYIVRQFIAAALGAIVFALVSGGVINLDQLTSASGAGATAMDQSSGYFAFAIGFLTGSGSYQVTRKLDDIIKVAFGRLTKDDVPQ